MTSPSIFLKSSQEQQRTLNMLEMASGDPLKAIELSKQILKTEDLINQISAETSALSKIVNHAFQRVKENLKKSVGDSQKIDAFLLPVRANLTDSFFGSEVKAYQETLSKIQKFITSIPDLDLTYFSAEYETSNTQAKIKEFVEQIDVFKEEKSKTSFRAVQEAIGQASIPLTEPLKAIFSIAKKGEIVKTLQERAKEISTFERDQAILKQMIELKKNQFSDARKVKAFISLISKEESYSLFTEVFSSLFSQASSKGFSALFHSFYNIIFHEGVGSDVEIDYINTFLFNLHKNISANQENIETSISEFMKMHFMKAAQNKEIDSSTLKWNIQFILNNRPFFDTASTDIFKTMIQTVLSNQTPDDAPAGVRKVITKEIYNLEGFKSVYDELSKTKSSLRAAQELDWGLDTTSESESESEEEWDSDTEISEDSPSENSINLSQE